MRKFDTGATRDTDDGKLDYEGFLSPAVLELYAQYMHINRIQADGELRASDNWQKGIPRDAYMKSLWRHFMEFWTSHRNDTPNSNAACAMLFNVMGYLHELNRVAPPKYFSTPATLLCGGDFASTSPTIEADGSVTAAGSMPEPPTKYRNVRQEEDRIIPDPVDVGLADLAFTEVEDINQPGIPVAVNFRGRRYVLAEEEK